MIQQQLPLVVVVVVVYLRRLMIVICTLVVYSQAYTTLPQQQQQHHIRSPLFQLQSSYGKLKYRRNIFVVPSLYPKKNEIVVHFAKMTENSVNDDDDEKEESDAISTTTTILSQSSASSASSGQFIRATQSDAQDALTAVGWSVPVDNGDLTSEDPFVQQIDMNLQKDMGITLEELLNPAKVVNLERDLYLYRIQLAELTGMFTSATSTMTTDATTTTTTTPTTTTLITTAECDNGGGGTKADELRKIIRKKEADLLIERRSVFRGWLKNVFLIQAIISFGLSYIMASDASLLFGQYDWYLNPKYNMDISINVLGYWWWWLFVIPSLRSRRPKGYEKSALDIAFLVSPLVSLVAPVITKDTLLIWYANAIVVAGAYAFAYVQDQTSSNDDNNDDNDNDTNTPEWLKFVYKSLDFGSGRERGARS